MSEEIIRYVQSACEGSKDAMAKLFSATVRTSFYLARKLSGNDEGAIEITKKAYARAFCTISKLKKPEAFEIWMKQNVASVYKESCVFDFSQVTENVAATDMEFLSADVGTDPDKELAVVTAVDGLEKEARAAVVLCYFSGMPVASLAKYFGVDEDAVNSVLESAKTVIAEACSSGEPAASTFGSMPVINGIFNDEMSIISVTGVREIFTYALDIYESFKNAGYERAKGATAEKYIKMKVPSVPQKEELSIPVKTETTPSYTAETEEAEEYYEEPVVDYSSFAGEKSSKNSDKKISAAQVFKKLSKVKIGKFDLKIIGIVVLALVVLVCCILGISKAVSKKNAEETGFVQVEKNDYEWKTENSSGVNYFNDCVSITYLTEDFCMFKSKTTGLYGLLDYEGNLVLEPNYEGFTRGSYGREYDGQETEYCALVTSEGVRYKVTMGADGQAEIDFNTPYQAPSPSQSILDKNYDYDDRDRYFNGYAAACKNQKWGYVSQENDKKVIDYKYLAVNTDVDEQSCDICRPVSKEGLVPVKDSSGLMGIIDLEGNTIVPFEYENIMPGENNVYIALKDGTWGVILVGSAKETYKSHDFTVTVTSTAVADDEESTDVTGESEDSEGTLYFCIADTGVNIRSGPGGEGEYDDIGDVAALEEVTVVGQETSSSGNPWYKIKLENGGYGYVSAKFFSKVTYY